MSLRDDYCELLKTYGLEPPPRQPSISEQLAALRRASIENPAESARAHLRQVLASLETIERMHPGALLAPRSEDFVTDGTGLLNAQIADVMRSIPKHAEISTCNLYIDVFPTTAFNAWAVPTRHGVLCLLNTGLVSFLYHLVSAACFRVRDHEGRLIIDDSEGPDGMTGLEYARAIAVRVVVEYLRYGKLDYPLPRSRVIEPWGIILANHISYSMKAFLIGHEVAHAVHGHVKHTRSAVCPSGYLRILCPAHEEEFEADREAQRTLLLSDQAERRAFPIACGGICFLLAHLMVLRVQTRLYRSREDDEAHTDSHPSSLSRIRALDAYLQAHAPQDDYLKIARLCALMWDVYDTLADVTIECNQDNITVIDRSH